MPATLMGWTRMKAPSSAAVAQTGSSSGSSRFLPAMFEPICAPRRPSFCIAWRSSSAASFGACMGSVAMARKRSGRALTSLASCSFWMRANAAASAGRLGINEGLRADRKHLHVDLGCRHVLQAPLQIPASAWEIADRHCRQRRGCRTDGRHRSAWAPPWALRSATGGSFPPTEYGRERRSFVGPSLMRPCVCVAREVRGGKSNASGTADRVADGEEHGS